MALSDVQLDDLRTSRTGTVTVPADPAWDDARRFHSGIGEPDVIVHASSGDDVVQAVRWAARNQLAIVVRGGGHSAWGTLPGGIVLDLAGLRGVEVVPDDGRGALVRVAGGEVWGDVARTLADRGLGISSGDTASVGVGGLTLGGGIGWMVRAWGLAADQLVGAQVVTAAGRTIEVSETSHPDLLWGLRGGGGNFGVVTRFDFRAHPLGSVVFASLLVQGDHADVLRRLRDILADAPRELTVTYMDVPPMDPSAPAGATIGAVWIGDDEETLRNLLAPITGLDAVSELEFGVRSYPDILLDAPEADPAEPMPAVLGGNTLLPSLTDDAIDMLVAFRAASPASVILLRSLGGAYADVDPDATAWSCRAATWFVMGAAFDVPGLVDDAERARILGDWDAIERLGIGVYGNFTTATDDTYVSRMYPPAAWERLGALKRTWDPGNLFCRNHNILPA